MKNFLKKKIKDVEISNTDKFIILFCVFILIILTFITSQMFELKWTAIPEIIRNLLLLFSGALGIQILNLMFNKKGQNTDTLCEYQKYLRILGIIQVYNKRKGAIEKGYLKDLLDEFRNLNKEHSLSDKPIKIIGASLDSFFKRTDAVDDLQAEIANLCTSTYFRVLLCNNNKNEELQLRLNFIKNKFNINKLLKDTPIYEDIDTSFNRIKQLCSNPEIGERLQCFQYEFSPYATIIILNDHIYYTPNMLDYASYLSREEVDDEDIDEYFTDAELSFCIRRYSEYGKRLEELFDSLWANEVSKSIKNIDKIYDKKVDDE